MSLPGGGPRSGGGMTRNEDGTWSLEAGWGYTGDGTRVEWGAWRGRLEDIPSTYAGTEIENGTVRVGGKS